MGSASELEYHVLLSHELGLLSDSGHTQLIERVTELKRMLAGLIGKVRVDR
jgi:four helix bundle protein